MSSDDAGADGDAGGPYEARTRRAQRRLRAGIGDALVIVPGPNLQYCTGVREEPSERHFFLVVPAAGEPALFVPEMYAAQLRAEAWVSRIEPWSDEDDPGALLADLAAEMGIDDGHLLVDDGMQARFTQDLRTTLPTATFGLASEVLADLRCRKDGAEIAALERAGRLADEVSEAVRTREESTIGATERELAWEIERRLRAAGGEGLSFDVIVGSGPNGANPHHRHGDREIRPGDPVVLDFGAYVDGYPGDQTRTVVFGGDPPNGFEAVHETVLAAQTAAVEAVEPGVSAGAVDRAAREVIEAAGYGDAFLHRTGHGVGLEVHEEPYLTADNDRELQPGMVFSVEPGIYLEGEYGVRIEDLVVVTEDGRRRLNDSPRTWEPL